MYKWVTSALFPHRCSLQMMLHVHGSIYSTCWIKLSFKMRLHWNLEWPPHHSSVLHFLSRFCTSFKIPFKWYLCCETVPICPHSCHLGCQPLGKIEILLSPNTPFASHFYHLPHLTLNYRHLCTSYWFPDSCTRTMRVRTLFYFSFYIIWDKTQWFSCRTVQYFYWIK